MNNKIKNIIFDFDGVLMDSTVLTREIISDFLPDFTKKQFDEVFRSNVYENPLVRKIISENNERFQERFHNEISEETFFEFAKYIIDELGRDYNLYINTSAPAKSVKMYLSYINRENSFEEILGKEDSFSKVEKFNMLIERFSLDINSCLFITDSLGDIFEANEVGVESIGVTWGVHSLDILSRGNPFSIANDYEELIFTVKNKENLYLKQKKN